MVDLSDFELSNQDAQRALASLQSSGHNVSCSCGLCRAARRLIAAYHRLANQEAAEKAKGNGRG